MHIHAPGKPVKGIIQTGDLSTAASFTLYDISTQEALTFSSTGINPRLILYLLSVSNGDTAAVVTVFDDKNGDGNVDAGEPLWAKSMAAKDLGGFEYKRGIALLRIPKVKASGASANTTVIFFGELQE